MNAVNMVTTCQMAQCLPGPGGVMDQDARLMELYRIVSVAQHERQELDRKRNNAKGGR